MDNPSTWALAYNVPLRYQLLEENGVRGIEPFKGTDGSVCYDLALPKETAIFPFSIVTVPLLIAFDIPEGFYIEIYPRSSLLPRHGVVTPTSIIDTDYKRGVHAMLYNCQSEKVLLYKGYRLLQFKIHHIEYVAELRQVGSVVDTTQRGMLGSTGT